MGLSIFFSLLLGGCSTSSALADSASTTTQTITASAVSTAAATEDTDTDTASVITAVAGSKLDVSDMFTERDLEQTADLENATYITLVSDEDVSITEEGVYVISGDVSNVTIEIDADDEAKVQLVLDGVSIVNTDEPAIYVVTADKVFITLSDSTNYLEVSGNYASTSIDAVIFSKSDLVLNGTGSLEVVSNAGNGITSKDDLKITGGTYTIQAAKDAIEANDSIRIYDGEISIVAGKDGLHSENDADNTLGYIYIYNVQMNISASDDGIQGNAIVQIDNGTINIETSLEGIEGTYVQINGGEIDIYATDDGINATQKSSYDVVLEINGGTITVKMSSGDTDALDSNGDLYINGGTVNITANSAFDYNGTGELNGGTVTVNGEVVTVLTQSQMGGGGRTQSGGSGKPGR